MVRSKAVARVAVLVVVGALAATPAHANLLTNGSFESPDIPTGFWGVFGSVPGWGHDGYGIEIQDHVAGSPCAGCGGQFVELDHYFPGSIYQYFPASDGHQYEVSFMYSPRPGVPAADNSIDVYWYSDLNGWYTWLGTLSADGSSLSDTLWTSHAFSFIADDPMTAVVFMDSGIGSLDGYGGYLDQVSVVETVPEPTTLTLLGLGLVALRARRRRSS